MQAKESAERSREDEKGMIITRRYDKVNNPSFYSVIKSESQSSHYLIYLLGIPIILFKDRQSPGSIQR
jgi:hypothetical protein